MSHKTPYLKVHEISLHLGGKALLDTVDFQIERGQRLAILGANGAGKTTLLRCLLGLQKPDSGQIILEGENLNSLTRSAIAQKIAYVPQGLNPEISLSVEDFVLMSRYSHSSLSQGIFPKDHDGLEIARTMMQRAGIDHLAHRSLNTLSGGERQKASISAALTQQSPILILDEPATYLDPKQQDSIHHLLENIDQSGEYTIITVTHDLNWAASHYDRLIGLKKGCIISDGSPKDFMTTENLAALFDAQWEIHPHPNTGNPMIIR